MGSVTFNGTISSSLYLGGIAGDLYSRDYDSTVKNCANYGDVTHSGTSGYSSVGGIVGYSHGDSDKRVYIYNCLNYGIITHNGTTSSSLRLGGIVGYTYYTIIENCVSGGKISSTKTSYIGSIVGYVSLNTYINYCYYSSELSSYSKYGYRQSPPSESNILDYDSTSFELDGTISIGSYIGNSLIDALNSYSDYYTLRGYSNWLLNKDKNDVTFTINRNSPFTFNSQIVLMPSLASEGKLCFNGWYTDDGLTTPLTSYEIMGETVLYGMFEENTNNYTIFFDTRREGVSVAPITAPFSSVVTLPSNSIREHCNVTWWETEYGDKVGLSLTVPSRDITLYAVWKCTRIETPEDFVDFSKVVNSGTIYSGTTVFLDSDLSFVGKTLDPIGNSEYNYFNGVFDGQGHVISNLVMTSSTSQFVGLFGYSQGLTIRNIIFDSSYSYNFNSDSGTVFIGGIIGLCRADYGACAIENSVNMGSVSFSGSIRSSLYLGGIAGHLKSSSDYDSTMKNCANYGDVTHSGYSGYSYIGGIVGRFDGYNVGSSLKSVYIYNCLNQGYGSLGTGISDYSVFTSFNNNFELSEAVSVGSYNGTSLINVLNATADYYALRDYFRWVLNEDGKAILFITNDLKTTTTLKSKVILLPSLGSKESMGFDGWYTDSAYSEPFTSTEITSDTNLYGRFKENTKSYTITFNTRGGTSIDPITAQFGSVVDLPKTPTKDFCTVASWETESGVQMPWKYSVLAHDVTLYALWNCTRIKTSSDFIDLSKIVNSRLSNYERTTVFLDSDIDFSGMTFEPIGKNNAFFFLGTFDGQGHVISNLKMTSSLQYVGLFGRSYGLTIKNVILDDSCSFISYFSGSNSSYVGGIIGYCYAYNGKCVIENNVNMGSVSFSGSISGNSLYLGGIVGYLYYKNYDSTVKNCANYGDVTHSGTSGNSDIGGIVGGFYGSSSKKVYIYNCLNHGTITHSGTTSSSLRLGGIVGYTYYTTIENCVNEGLISSITTASNSNYIGNICGLVSGYSIIKYCFWNKTINYDAYEYLTSSSISATTSFNDNFELSEIVSIGSYTGNSLIDVLNAAADYYTLRNYSHWLLNKEKKIASFTINGRTSPIKMDYQIILLPSLEREGKLCFDGWYTDSAYSESFTTSEITSDINLYGRTEENTKSYAITFNTRGGTTAPEPITAQFGSVVNLPKTPTKGLCTVASWETEYGDQIPWSYTVLAHNVTLYALWNCTHIKTASDFIDLSRIVNSGPSKYERTTVFLDSDIDFSGMTFEPIGTSNSGQFLGSFYGQGHVISNLKMSIYLEHVGLFGYSENIIINDLVIDSSCSFSRLYSNSDSHNTFVSSVIGVCGSYNFCGISNVVNMADVSYNDRISSYFIVAGGIVGKSAGTFVMSNCVNFGSLKLTAKEESNYVYLGGLAGEIFSSGFYVLIKNCINYGYLKNDVSAYYELFLGGIVGVIYSNTFIENCLSSGSMLLEKTSKKVAYLGSIVGNRKSSYSSYKNNTIYNCFWAENVGDFNPIGQTVTNPALVNITNTYAIEMNESSLNILYGLMSTNSQQEWAIAHLYGGRISDVPHEKLILSRTYVPSPLKANRSFEGWSTDCECNGRCDVEPGSSCSSKDIHALWNLYTMTLLTFDDDNRTIVQELAFGSKIVLPTDLSKRGYSFSKWDSTTATMPLYDLTFKAIWTANVYTVTFDVNGGTSSQQTKEVTYDEHYSELPEASRVGYTFNGWYTEVEGGEEVKSETRVTNPNHHTLYAHWNINQYTITFSVDGGSECENITQDYNTEVELPKPTKTGYTFDCWCSDPELSREYTETTMPAEDVTLYAKWSINQYNLTFVFNNGDENEMRTLDYNEEIVYPVSFKKTGYTFNGWDIKPDRMPAENITVTA